MGEINRRYFESLMSERKLSLRGLAEKMGLGHSQLSLTFSGSRKLTLEEAAQLSQIFGEPLHRIVENAGVSVRPTSGRQVPVMGAVAGDGTVGLYSSLQNDGAPLSVIERMLAPEDLPDDALAIQFRTVGTPLEWLDGSVMFCRKPDRVSAESFGRLSLLKIKDGPVAVGTIKRGYREGTYNVTGPFQRENVVLEWASPILITRN
ncbi:helix-turn-helix transcriptional regulator [Chitiniphilus purpureus]|uniref:Helix-turn-helix transcriptional regulator n=1 Tax=Chitiniphilus purpureus TaxID=2981137 RepID=A0ABY6DVB1_9NEIS|nr:helix-turn-helix transcriptional regulator [Chitiniphilus sp. CD1]UXY17001.1 helix-turn-helix transcriptional regulator [Chitiniphilus sp. CD1]